MKLFLKKIKFNVQLIRSLLNDERKKIIKHDVYSGGLIVYCGTKLNQAGFAHTMRSIATAFAFAKSENMRFNFHFEQSLPLSDHLLINEKFMYKDEYIYFPSNLFYIDQTISERDNFLQLNKESINYIYGYFSSNYFKKRFDISSVIKEIFAFSPEIKSEVNFVTEKYKDFCACHIRVQNSLGEMVEDSRNSWYKKELSKQEKRELMEDVKKAIAKLNAEKGSKVFVFSDSFILKDYLRSEKHVIIRDALELGHVGYSQNKSASLKEALIDFLLLSHSTCIFALVNKYLYPSGFPALAADYGGVEFKRLHI